MDTIDNRIVAVLRRDARTSNRELARIVGLAPSTTLARVRSLEQRGVITGYSARVDVRKIGTPIEALVFVRLRPKNDGLVREFMAAAWELDSVSSVTLITGNDDAVLHVVAASPESLRSVVLGAIGRLPGVIDERTALVFEHRSR